MQTGTAAPDQACYQRNKKTQESHVRPCLQGLRGHGATTGLLHCALSSRKSCQARHVNIYRGHFSKAPPTAVSKGEEWSWCSSVQRSSRPAVPSSRRRCRLVFWLSGEPRGLELWTMIHVLRRLDFPVLALMKRGGLQSSNLPARGHAVRLVNGRSRRTFILDGT